MTTRPATAGSAIRASTTLAGIAITALAASVALPGTAAAATITVSPADRIDTAEGFCTIGYTYNGTDGHTYAITAGHCATHTGQRVTDTDTGAVGTFVRADVDDDHRGGPDYGLIDFGKHALALGFVGNYPVADAHPTPRPGQPICHTGVSSGQQCGHVSDTYGPDQYLTTDDMARSIPGDSGGPVWTLRDDGRVEVIGIWLGGRRTFGGHDAGRFATLQRAFTDLT
jgi:streptogrisin B